MSTAVASQIGPKTILVAGLGRFLASAAPEGAPGVTGTAQANRQAVNDNLEKARQNGFDPTDIEVNPDEAANSLNSLRALLQSKHFDGFIIGFGIRGNKKFTDLFESLVNTSREVSPTTRLGFSIAPGAVYETMVRMFPGGEKK
jgi:hypothetical protein